MRGLRLLAGLALSPGFAFARADAPAPGGADGQLTPAAQSPSAEGASGAAPPGTGLVYGGNLDLKSAVDVIKQSGGQPVRVSAFADAELSGYLNYGSWLSLNTTAKLERTRNSNLASYFVDRNQAFRSEAVTLRQLYATVRPADGVAFYGGKIHPRFGSAWENTPGIFYNYGTDYEQDERVGFGVELRLPEWTGGALLSAEAFFLDTSVLSDTFLSRVGFRDESGARRQQYRSTDGGPSNTGRPESLTVALRGDGGPFGLDGLQYQVSATREVGGQPDERTEYGVSASVQYKANLTRRLSVTPFLEYAWFDNFGAQPGLRRHYAVGGVAFNQGPWELDVAGGVRRSRGLVSAADTQANLTLTYEVFRGFRLGAGVNYVHLAGHDSFVVSPALSYGISF